MTVHVYLSWKNKWLFQCWTYCILDVPIVSPPCFVFHGYTARRWLLWLIDFWQGSDSIRSMTMSHCERHQIIIFKPSIFLIEGLKLLCYRKKGFIKLVSSFASCSGRYINDGFICMAANTGILWFVSRCTYVCFDIHAK